MSSLLGLPAEVAFDIFAFFNRAQLCDLRPICSHFMNFIDNYFVEYPLHGSILVMGNSKYAFGAYTYQYFAEMVEDLIAEKPVNLNALMRFYSTAAFEDIFNKGESFDFSRPFQPLVLPNGLKSLLHSVPPPYVRIRLALMCWDSFAVERETILECLKPLRQLFQRLMPSTARSHFIFTDIPRGGMIDIQRRRPGDDYTPVAVRKMLNELAFTFTVVKIFSFLDQMGVRNSNVNFSLMGTATIQRCDHLTLLIMGGTMGEELSVLLDWLFVEGRERTVYVTNPETRLDHQNFIQRIQEAVLQRFFASKCRKRRMLVVFEVVPCRPLSITAIPPTVYENSETDMVMFVMARREQQIARFVIVPREHPTYESYQAKTFET